MVSVHMPTTFGDFDLIAYRHIETGQEHLALRKGEWTKDEPILVRVHSSCITGDIFGSCRCDCGPQLHKAMEMIEKEGKGVILYMKSGRQGYRLVE
jgi:3,4-dihydroxy 2-butanone 4-phosphate synthase/GTP cyclohydrolase II